MNLIFRVSLIVFVTITSNLFATHNTTSKDNFNAPENDLCSNAVELKISSFPFSSATTLKPTVKNATQSSFDDVALPSCNNRNVDDIWFYLTIPQSGNIGISTKDSFETTFAVSLVAYEGSCGNFSEIKCSNEDGWKNRYGSIRLYNRTPGEKIYIRAWGPTSTSTDRIFLITAFDVEASENNFCSTPTNLSVGKSFEDKSITTDISNLTNSKSTDPSGCLKQESIRDHWYTVTVPNSGKRAIAWDDINDGGIPGNTLAVVYNGECNNLSEIDYCSFDDNRGIFRLEDRTPGEKITVRFSHYNLYELPKKFIISAYDDTPINNLCNDATVLAVGSNFNDSYLPVEISYFADINTSTKNRCCDTPEVWYKVKIPSSGNLTVEIKNELNSQDKITNKSISIFSGSCDNLSRIKCDTDTQNSPFKNKITITGRTPGETLYVSIPDLRKGDYFFWIKNPFLISAYDSSVVLNIDEFDVNNIVTILSPNPVNSKLNIKSDEILKEVSVFDIQGKKVLFLKRETFESNLDVSKLSPGIYFTKLYFKNFSREKTIKFIKH